MKTKVVQAPEDPAAAAARVAEQKRAEASRISETQGNLDASTLRRLRRFGKLGAPTAGQGGGASITAPNGFGSPGSPGGAPDPAAVAAALGGGFRGFGGIGPAFY